MKKIIILVIFSFLMSNVFSQVNSEIKRHSRNNQSEKNNESSESSSSSNNSLELEAGDACVDACVSACVSGFFNILIDVLVDDIAEKNGEYVENKKDDVPYISHFDMAFQLGVLPNQYLVYLPRIRGQYGVFGTDFRVYHNREYRFKETDPYTTYDWQILVLNLVSVKEVNWRIASGIMVESFDTENFFLNEHTMAFSIFPKDRIQLNIEGRLAPDYQTGIFARQEVNANILYQINKSKHAKINLMLGVLSARYYEKVNVWTTSLGTSITFQ